MVTRTPFGNDDAVITQPATLASGDSTRGVLFFHGAGSNHLDMALSAKWRPTRDAVIDAGGILVECRGNGFSDVGDETGTRNWGREWSRDAYRAAAEIAGSEEHTSELKSLMRISFAVFWLQKKMYT